MAATPLYRCLLSTLRTHTRQRRGLESLAGRTASRLPHALIWNQGEAEGHTGLDKAAPLGRDEKNGQRRSSLLFQTASVGLGLFGAALWLGQRELTEEDRPGSVARRWLPLVVPSAHCASPFKPDSPRYKYNFIADVVEKSTPAVVCVEILGVYPFTGEEVVSNGSGFIITKDGLIVTNAHVVANKKGVRVRLNNGEVYDAVVQDADEEADIAIIKINVKNPLPTLPLGCSAEVRQGEFVVAMGNPYALRNTITSGIVSSVQRRSKELGLSKPNMDYIQTDATIADGEVIGINTMSVNTGFSFAISSDRLKVFLKEVEQSKNQKRRYIGVTMVTLNPSLIKDLKLVKPSFPEVTHGVLIHKVLVDSPADRVGMLAGDIVVAINGVKVNSAKDVYQAAESSEQITITIQRGDKLIQMQLTPEYSV